MTRKRIHAALGGAAAAAALATLLGAAQAQTQKPNIILIVSDDFGYGDAGPYGGGENRGMPTPALDRLASEGMTFQSSVTITTVTPVLKRIDVAIAPLNAGEGPSHSVTTYKSAVW